MAKLIAAIFLFVALIVLAIQCADEMETTPGATCPEGWFQNGDVCYLRQQFHGTAQEAAAYCTSLQAFLSVFHGQANGDAYIECSKYAQ